MQHHRWKAALVALVLGVSGVVAACGDDEESTGGGTASGGSDKKSYDMTLIAGVKGDEFYITMNCGAQEEAKKLGYTLDFQAPTSSTPPSRRRSSARSPRRSPTGC